MSFRGHALMQAATIGDRDFSAENCAQGRKSRYPHNPSKTITDIGSCRAAERTRRDASFVTNDRQLATAVLLFGNNRNGI